jgi:hypothetical protein
MKRAIIFLSWFSGVFPQMSDIPVNLLLSFMILHECIWHLGKSFSQEFSGISYLLTFFSSGHRWNKVNGTLLEDFSEIHVLYPVAIAYNLCHPNC